MLIVDGYGNHDWSYSTECIKSLLLNSGLCRADVTTAPAVGAPGYDRWQPAFDKYDVIVQNTNSIGNGNYWPEKVQADFEKYMKNGGGMLVFHSANNAFGEWGEYNRMIGLGWRKPEEGYAIEIRDGKMVKIPPGVGDRTRHGPRKTITVELLKKHPINKGYPKKWLTPDIELYTYARGPAEDLEVLSYTYDEKTGKNWPVDWVIRYGKGRVYNATYGHIWHDLREPQGIQCVGFQTSFLRAVQWLANGKVTYEVPADFPTETNISLRPFELVYLQEDGWKDLFNGEDLDGWAVKCLPADRDKVFWKVNDGMIECDSIGRGDHHYVWLMTEDEFDDFELRMEFQIFKSSTGNSGVQFRSRYDDSASAPSGGWLNGPQVDIHPPMPLRAGLIYDETQDVKRWIYPSLENAKMVAEKAPKPAHETELVYADNDPDAWNTMELDCDGMKIETFVNGRRVTDFDATGVLDDETHHTRNVGTRGKIALQLHSKSQLLIRFKNLRIRKKNSLSRHRRF
ncbi:MAG: DUF1080 domain-containing protein [Planctomycetes bacterium]|nr:DUF1080 domain-containing protein [Planctomycetota bacterium]